MVGQVGRLVATDPATGEAFSVRYGPAHLEVARTLGSLGCVLADLGAHRAAQALHATRQFGRSQGMDCCYNQQSHRSRNPILHESL